MAVHLGIPRGSALLALMEFMIDRTQLYRPLLGELMVPAIKPADPVEDVFCWKDERPAGYSRSHWRKIRKERLSRQVTEIRLTGRSFSRITYDGIEPIALVRIIKDSGESSGAQSG